MSWGMRGAVKTGNQHSDVEYVEERACECGSLWILILKWRLPSGPGRPQWLSYIFDEDRPFADSQVTNFDHVHTYEEAVAMAERRMNEFRAGRR